MFNLLRLLCYVGSGDCGENDTTANLIWLMTVTSDENECSSTECWEFLD
jgi:hypothetical protein